MSLRFQRRMFICDPEGKIGQYRNVLQQFYPDLGGKWVDVPLVDENEKPLTDSSIP